MSVVFALCFNQSLACEFMPKTCICWLLCVAFTLLRKESRNPAGSGVWLTAFTPGQMSWLAVKCISLNYSSVLPLQHPGHAGNLHQYLHHTCQHPFHLCHIFMHQGSSRQHVFGLICPCIRRPFCRLSGLFSSRSSFLVQCRLFQRRLSSLAPTAPWLGYLPSSSSSSLPLLIW